MPRLQDTDQASRDCRPQQPLLPEMPELEVVILRRRFSPDEGSG